MAEIVLITKEQQQTSTWTGGTTTQISIYPPKSNFLDRDFMWRLSTAYVEVEESNFTKLAGFDRHLMVLEGRLELVHKGQHSVVLQQYEQDSFKGGDFNLMLKEGIKGKLEHYKAASGVQFKVELQADGQRDSFFACYCHRGQICLYANNQNVTVGEGDLLLINYNDYLTITLENKYIEECNLIAVFIEIY